MPAPLITLNDIRQKHQISNSINLEKFNEIVYQSELQDLKPLLGKTLFDDLISNPGTHEVILNPLEHNSENTDHNHGGLKEVLGYFVYGRLVMFGGVINNPFGFTKKLNSDSEQLSYSEKKAYWNEMRDIAFNLWLDVKRYMVLNEYGLYQGHNSKSTKGGGFRINKIG